MNKLKGIVNSGGEFGVSSVWYGTLDKENIIEADSYELVRYLDFVLYPSYSVFITDENNDVKENTKNTDSYLENNIKEETPEITEETIWIILDCYFDTGQIIQNLGSLGDSIHHYS